MIKEIIGVCNTELEALNDAKKQLGLNEDDEVKFELIQRAEKKKFGLFGGAPAKVKILLNENVADVAQNFLRSVLDAMQLENIEIARNEIEGGIKFELVGDGVGFAIGKRGETLDSLQYLTSLVANHAQGSYIKITVDTGNYREKREKTLEILGRKLAFKAVKTGRKSSLEPMNPYERRIIHTAVQKINGAISWSEGENAHRHVVIGPDPKSKNFHKNGHYNKDKGGKRSYNSNRKEQPSVDPNREPINEGGETGLYGRIDK